MAKGESGYINASITLTTGGTYTGGGNAGWTGGTPNTFAVYMRKPAFQRPRQDTTDGANKSGVGGPTSVKVDFEGYFKGANYPPVLIMDEFVKVVINTIFTFTGVVMVESFVPTGEVDGSKGVYYAFSGESDGAFTNT